MGIFNKLKRSAKNMPQYFGDREIVSFTVDTMNPERVLVAFKDGTEDMSSTEFNAGLSDVKVESPADLQKLLVKRTVPMCQDLQNVFKKYNPRVNEIASVLTRIQDSISEGYNTAIDGAFGVKNFAHEGTVDQVCKLLEDKGVDVYAGMNEAQKAILQAIRSTNTTVFEITHRILFTTLTQKIETLTDQSIDVALGGTADTRRCDDLEKYRDTSKDKPHATEDASDPSGTEQKQEVVAGDVQPVQDGGVKPETGSPDTNQNKAGDAPKATGAG